MHFMFYSCTPYSGNGFRKPTFQFKTIELLKLKMIIPLLLVSLSVSEAKLRSELNPQNSTGNNWTTCEEFLEGATFDASSILDKDWKVFYTWSPYHEDPYQVRFRKPSSELIKKFIAEVGHSSVVPHCNDTAFYMESTMDMSALFVKTAIPGIFSVITSLVFEYNVTEEVIFAMKLVEPGYLAFMNCKMQVVVALAPLDKFPKNDELEEAAKLLKIRHPHGYAYNVHDTMLHYDPALAEEAFEEDQIEVEVNSGFFE